MSHQQIEHDDQADPSTPNSREDEAAPQADGSFHITEEDIEGLEEISQDSLQAQRDDLESRLVRVSADYQNYVRRSQKNTVAACDEQLMRLTKALLTPLDQFDQALAVDPEHVTAESILQGVQIVRDELMKVLEQYGVKRLEVQPGEEFDPMRHEAVQRLPMDDFESGAVAQQLQPGYTLGDKTLRPAKVIVVE